MLTFFSESMRLTAVGLVSPPSSPHFQKKKTALETVMEMTKKSLRTTLDEKIEAVRREKKRTQKTDEQTEKKEGDEENMEVEGGEGERNSEEVVEKGGDGDEDEDEEDVEEIAPENSKVMTKEDKVKIKEDIMRRKKKKEDSFFEEGPIVDPESSFAEMNLSRPLMKVGWLVG